MTQYLLYLYAESPVHTGAANSVDVLDLPIQREAATGYPVIWGQSLKGALRQAARDANWEEPLLESVFGSVIGAQAQAGEEAGTKPGNLAVGDAQLVAMPVPTLRHTFAWATSEVALGRLARKYKILGRPAAEPPELPKLTQSDSAAGSSKAWSGGEEVLGPCVVPFGSAPSEPLARWAAKIAQDALSWDPVFQPFADKLRTDFVMPGSEIVPVLLKECTEQAVRVQLKQDTKTVKDGALFYSEYLPSETIMAASLALSGNAADTPENREKLTRLLDKNLLQFGGDETIGKGLMWTRLLAGQPSGRR